MSTSEAQRPDADKQLGNDSPNLRRRASGITEEKNVPTPAQATPEMPGAFSCRVKTVLAIICMWSTAPFLILWALYAWLKALLCGPPFKRGSPKQTLNILVTGGKMSKACAVARAVGRDGHKVFTAEILPYRFCHTRFGAYVSKHYVLPRPVEQQEAWEATIKHIVQEHSIDVIIPCTAPVESSAYAHLRKVLPAHVRVFAFDGETTDILDNKFTFNEQLVKAGLSCPETVKMECLKDAVQFFEGKTVAQSKRYIVKPGVYDPAARTEILYLPIEDAKKQNVYLETRNASKRTPYVIQEVLSEPEYACAAWFNNGALTAFELVDSCASCLMYQQLPDRKQYESVMELNRSLGKSMNLTGQFCLDLMHTASGELVPIECNPRIHSTIVTLEGDVNLGALLSDAKHLPASDVEIVTSDPKTMKYWFMDQLMLHLGFWEPKSCFKLGLREMLCGTDALLHGDDPLPFLAMYLVQIPSLLVLELISGGHWRKIDFCIGKIVKVGGD